MSHETDRQGHVVGRVAGLRAFPVKSMTAPRLEHARVETSGLQHDRVWAVVDDEGAVVPSAVETDSTDEDAVGGPCPLIPDAARADPSAGG